jgi:hypothetical protein
MFTDKHIKSLKPRTAPFRVSEDTNRRGVGRLIVEVKPTGNRYLFYKYFQKLNGKSNKTLISLGRYKSSPRASGISLADARTKVLEFENLQRNGKDPKAYLVAKKLDEQEESRKIVQKKSHGTFDDLLNAYLEKMESDGKRSVQQVRRSLKTYVRDPFPELLPVRAKKIDTDDIRRIISRMIANKITTHSNRVRSYLHAAFQI